MADLNFTLPSEGDTAITHYNQELPEAPEMSAFAAASNTSLTLESESSATNTTISSISADVTSTVITEADIVGVHTHQYLPEAETSLPFVPAPSTLSVAVVETFELFPNLPLELRRDIWGKSILPRLVHWRPGGGKPPVLLSTSKEARGVCLEKYTVCFDAYHRNETYAIFTAFGLDTLYCKNKLPDNVYMKRVRFHPVNTILPKGVSGRELNLRSWTRSVRSLMVNLDDAAAGVSHTRRQGLWEKLALTCPELEELNIVFSHNAKVRKHHSLKDLVEADLSIATGPQLALIVQFRLAHQAQLAEGKFLGLKVNFVQLSPLASRALDKLLQGPDATPGSNARPKFIKPSRRYPERYRYRK